MHLYEYMYLYKDNYITDMSCKVLMYLHISYTYLWPLMYTFEIKKKYIYIHEHEFFIYI
jgi:hypothetical protein